MDHVPKTSRRWILGKRPLTMLLLILGTPSCASYVRIPLAVPLPAVGGARPATPQGLELFGNFGDGVWGQEQERAEMIGSGIALAVRDRVELSASAYQSTRAVQDQYGVSERGEATNAGGGKIRLADWGSAKRGSVGIHVGFMESTRVDGDVQDEHFSAWDVAVPVEYYPLLSEGVVDRRWSVYAAPRLIIQTFDDRLADVTDKGTLAAGLLGTAARWRHFSVAGELNIAHTTPLGAPTGVGGDWLVLPAISFRGMIPLG